MRRLRNLFLLFAFLFTSTLGFAQQGWSLVWQDEFEGSIGPDWVFETGNNGGWGNNELEYYRRENATVENGALVITAKREDVGGFRYTSTRMKTQGKKSWKYGRMEARIAVPLGSGLWPAFWMLGSNIGQVGWPASGEIDIMEHINSESTIYGTPHWAAADGSHASYGGSTNTTPQNYHVYSVEWDANAIKWFVDGVQYHVIDITNGTGSTEEFHKDFFFLLNLAVGGNWPGFNIDESKLPAKMYVDYVRVYQKGDDTGTYNAWALDGTAKVIRHQNSRGRIDKAAKVSPYQDANWKLVPGLAGAGVSFQSQNFPDRYLHQRNGELWLDASDGTQGFKEAATFYKRSGLSNAAATSFEAYNLPGQYIRQKNALLYVKKAATNTTKKAATFKMGAPLAGAFSTTIEAESYADMSGIQTEACSEGGQDVGWIDTNDWIVWDVNLPSAGTYKVEYRVASQNGGGVLQLEKAGGVTVYGSVNVPATGGWQTWTTVSHNVMLPAGQQQIAVKALAGGWNLNWLKISQ